MLANLNTVIDAGESVSVPVDCSGGQIVRITLPEDYTESATPVMTFLGSSDGVVFHDLVDSEGKQIAITARADTTIVIADVWTRAVGFLQLRAGSSAYPQPQETDVAISLALMPSTAVAFGGGGTVVSDTPPADAADGTLWWDSREGPSAAKRLYVKYFDGSSSQWVAAEQ